MADKDARAFHQVLLAVVRREYDNDAAITIQILKEKVFPDKDLAGKQTKNKRKERYKSNTVVI